MKMTLIVAVLNVPHVHRLTNAWNLKQILCVVEQISVLPNELLVALEVHRIHGVEADERHEQPNISLCQFVPCNVPLLRQNLLALVQRCKQRMKRSFVGLLLGRESALVNAGVDISEHPAVYILDGGLQVLGVQVHLRMLRYAVVELVVEHLHNVLVVVVDNLPRLRIPKDGNGEAACVVWI